MARATPATPTSLNNLAELYKAMGDYAAAEPLYRQAIKICRAALGEGHPRYATSLNNLAKLYRSMGDYAAAEPLYRQALEITARRAGRGPPRLRRQPEQPGGAVPVDGRLRGGRAPLPPGHGDPRAALGEGHPDYADSLNNLAILSVATDRERDALALMQEAAAIDDRMIGQIFSIGSEQQRAAFLATLQGKTNPFLSLVLNHLDQSHEAVQAALDLVLRRKAIEGRGTGRPGAMRSWEDGILTSSPGSGSSRRCGRRSSQKTLAGPGPEGARLTTSNCASGPASETASRESWPAASPR